MTRDAWLGSLSAADFYDGFRDLTDRKVHLLTAAFLRRVWDDLPSEHTRIAVEATEKFVDNRLTVDQLARLRSTDVLESCEPIWLDPDGDFNEEQLIGRGCLDCWVCDERAAEYECSVAKRGYVLTGVRKAVEEPAWVAVQALLFTREVAGWKAEGDTRDTAQREEASAQYEVFREIVGPAWTAPGWPRWRTSDVVALARGIHADRAFDRMPILADALQDAGCSDEAVLRHCRAAKESEHVRGCWVVDLAMGVS